jgi:hypothetical protein
MDDNKYEIIATWETDKYFREKKFSLYYHSTVTKDMSYEDDKVIDFLSYNFRADHSSYGGGIYASRKIKLIESYWEDFKERIGQRGGIPYTISAEPKGEQGQLLTNFGIGKVEVTDEEEIIMKSRDRIVSHYQNILFPLLEKQSDIHCLNEEYNNPYHKNYGGRWYHKLIIAKLSGNRDYEKIYNYVIGFFMDIIGKESNEKYLKKYKATFELFPELYERLKNEKPLKDPYLGSKAHPFNRSN